MEQCLLTKGDGNGIYDLRIIWIAKDNIPRLKAFFVKARENWEISSIPSLELTDEKLSDMEKALEEREKLLRDSKAIDERLKAITNVIKV